MTVVHDFAEWPRGPLFVTVGVFDGVHVGHREVIKGTAQRAHAQGGRAIATTFDPLPIQILAPAAPPFGLSDIDERTQLLHDAGADDVVIFHFTREFAAITPSQFIERVAGAGEVRQIVVGDDFQFGHDRAGTFSPLADVLPHHQVVLGLVTTKDGTLEDPENVVARVQEASEHVPLERLALSPQCGFASGEIARTMTLEEQEAKLRLVGDVARRVWT